ESGITGTVAICGDAAGSLEPVLQRFLDNLVRRLELENEKEVLQEELGISWECLEAVYDITANLRSQENLPQLLERIISKAASIQEGLRIILWLADEEQLEVAAAKNVEPLQPRSPTPGLLGQTLAKRQSIVINDRSRLATIDDL